MTTTNYTVGLGSDPKTSSRILKPPGGASSDIFGTNASNGQDGAGRRANNYNKSNLFEDGSSTATPAEQASENRRQAGNGTISSIFGGPDLTPYQTPRKVKDYMKSSVFGTNNALKEDQLNGNHTVLITDKKTDEGDQESADSENSTDSANSGSLKQGGGNPITGEGYNAEVKDEGGSFLPAVKVRNPPGGHSTKLW